MVSLGEEFFAVAVDAVLFLEFVLFEEVDFHGFVFLSLSCFCLVRLGCLPLTLPTMKPKGSAIATKTSRIVKDSFKAF